MSTFAEQLANLSNPAPTFNDPEIEEDDTNAKVIRVADDNENNDQDQQISKLRKSNILLLSDFDAKYTGRKVSRSNIEDEDEDGGGSTEEENSVYNTGDSSVDEEDDQDDGSKGIPDTDDGEGNSESYNSLDVSSDGESSDGESSDDEDLESEEEEIKPFMVKDTDAERERGNAVKIQLSLWDNILQGRIKMQPTITLLNQLPFHDQWDKHINDSDEIQQSLAQGQKNIANLMDVMINLQTLLLGQNSDTFSIVKDDVYGGIDKNIEEDDEEITSSEDDEEEEDSSRDLSTKVQSISIKKRKLTLEEYPNFISKRYKRFENYRNQTIQKWYDKTRISSGKFNKNFSSFEQSALKQIEQILGDRMRLVKRTQLKRFSNNIIGTQEVAEKNTRDKEYFTEIYNDDDFYHQLLRSFIESKTSNTGDVSAFSKQWIEIQNLRSKLKRKVDTRSSKGRKIRHDIHRKLINFMAPRDTSNWTDDSRNDLFRSLFGQVSVR